MPFAMPISLKPWKAAEKTPMEKTRYFPALEIPPEGISLDDVERELIEIALRQAAGNRTQAARLLGISRDTLRYRIKKFDLRQEFRRNGSSTVREQVPVVTG
jgi:two-component system, NtrC family, response regulator AtoC